MLLKLRPVITRTEHPPGPGGLWKRVLHTWMGPPTGSERPPNPPVLSVLSASLLSLFSKENRLARVQTRAACSSQPPGPPQQPGARAQEGRLPESVGTETPSAQRRPASPCPRPAARRQSWKKGQLCLQTFTGRLLGTGSHGDICSANLEDRCSAGGGKAASLTSLKMASVRSCQMVIRGSVMPSRQGWGT